MSTTSSGSRTATDAKAPATPERILRWDGCVNVRDLGGLPLAGGGETAYRVVVRADWLPGLSEAGRQALVDYGVSLVVDLRPDREHEADGISPLPVPVVRQGMDPRPLQPAWDWPSMREAYLALADHYRAELAHALTLLGDAEPPAAIHCAGGRDRTGIACGMALWLAGAEPDAIAADHALSDENWAPFNEGWLAEAPDEAERDRRRRVSQPAGRTLVDVLEEIEQREGIRNLLVGAGADESALDRLVTRLKGEA
ncbi:MAG TPA: tyrosine-protein phosphatase [Gaiellaceae bacterium]